MRIGCIGWGSLIWNPKELPIELPWFQNGPTLPVEFARESSNGRVTLVIAPEEYPQVQTLWATMLVDELGVACNLLAHREGIKSKNAKKDIGIWKREISPRNYKEQQVSDWAQAGDLDAVIWTDLPFGFKKMRGHMPQLEDVLGFLNKRNEEDIRCAEEYIRKTPNQIATPYRKAIEQKYGWTPII